MKIDVYPPRIWADAEVAATVAFINRQDPGFMDELAESERASRDLADNFNSIGGRFLMYVTSAQPDADHAQLVGLLVAITRKARRLH
jgi:hypothetical protein